jgi:hypothetical protein
MYCLKYILLKITLPASRWNSPVYKSVYLSQNPMFGNLFVSAFTHDPSGQEPYSGGRHIIHERAVK